MAVAVCLSVIHSTNRRTLSTEYVKEVILVREGSLDPGAAVRAGSLALLCFSCMSIVGAVLLPLFHHCGGAGGWWCPSSSSSWGGRRRRWWWWLGRRRGRRHRSPSYHRASGSGRTANTTTTATATDSNFNSNGIVLLWTGSHFLFAACMLATVFVRNRWDATVLIGVVGLCWAAAMWVPVSFHGWRDEGCL